MRNADTWSARSALTVPRVAHGSALSQAAALREHTAVFSNTASAAAAAAAVSMLPGTVACGQVGCARVSAQRLAWSY